MFVFDFGYISIYIERNSKKHNLQAWTFLLVLKVAGEDMEANLVTKIQAPPSRQRNFSRVGRAS